ncbi:CTD nuclear envelope phosphatase 1 homolog isoform X2 [Drosophila elegans]|uniref:CTD nuclear envelope phosphatase 1 homolog isoform X2 n=1 Tax=Drosophila elegans TaxID=30023 RepID=UPI001BC86046|nr:CTD nuclear envelope phosphatase 1 homolog isoform X2 [Drosophila elegans]
MNGVFDPRRDSFMIYLFVLATVGLMTSMVCLVVPQLRLWLAGIYKIYADYTPVVYLSEDRLSTVSKRRLKVVAKKTLVLDMDETLITSWIKKSNGRGKKSPPGVPHDFEFPLPDYDGTVFVYKRPHVDYFLNRVSKWYDLVIFTAGAEIYASPILDFLDRGRGILSKRLYRHHCIDVLGLRAKYISLVSPDLANVLLLDNSTVECSFNAGNAIHIKPYRIGRRDEALINLLPFLDALRFTKDVRSVLQRCTRFECLTTLLESVTL